MSQERQPLENNADAHSVSGDANGQQVPLLGITGSFMFRLAVGLPIWFVMSILILIITFDQKAGFLTLWLLMSVSVVVWVFLGLANHD